MKIQTERALSTGYSNFIKFLNFAISYLVPVFYFLVAVMFYLRTYDSAQIKITIVQIGGAIILALFLMKIIEENSWKYFIEHNIYTLPLFVFMVSAVVSFFRSPFPFASGAELIRRVAYFTLSMVILKEFNDYKKVKRLFNWVLAATFVSTAYGIIQFLDRQFFPPPPEPGLDPFIWRQAFGYKIFSTFGNPNFYGDFLAVTSPIALAHFLKTKKPFYLILWLMIALNTYLTYSKGAWIGFAVGLVLFVYLGITYFLHKSEKVKKYLIYGMVAFLLILALGLYREIVVRMSSIRFRQFTWLSCWEMINTKPILGTGIGTFYVTYPAWRRPQIFHIEGKHNTESDHPENEYLEIWFDEGMVGLGIFLWLLSVFIIGGLKTLRAYSNIDNPGRQPDARAYYLLGTLCALGGMLTHNFVCVSLRFVSSGVMLWFLIGMIGSLAVNNPMRDSAPLPSPGEKPPVRIKRIIQILILIPTVWAVKIFYGYFMADIYHNIAIFYSKQGNWPEALKHYEKVVKNNYGFIMTHYFMGNVYNDRWQPGDIERAIKKYEDVWRLAPNYVQSHHQAGLVYLKWGDEEKRKAEEARQRGDIAAAAMHEKQMNEIWDKALKQFEKYRMIDPVFAPNYYRMAYIYIQRGNFQKAEEMYLAAVDRRDPPDYRQTRPEATINLGNLKYMQGDIKGAKEWYEKTLEFEPNNVTALKNLAVIYGRLGQHQEAQNAWIRLRSIAPNDEDVKRVFTPK